MTRKHSIKHELENAIVTITRLSHSLEPMIARIVEELAKTNSQIVTERQRDILQEAMQMIREESLIIKTCCDKLIAHYVKADK